jgi:hypothetical protein
MRTMTNKKRLIFDTTGINRFAEDRKSADPLIAGLTSGYIVRVTATNVEESIATDNADKRNRLLEVCKQLIKGDGGEIIRPFHWITEGLIAEFERTGRVDWENVPLRLPAYEREVALREIIDDNVSADERKHAATVKSSFEAVFTDARPHFEELFRDGKESRPSSVADLVGRLQGPGGAYWNFGQGFYERVAKRRPDEETIRGFVAQCPPFQALLLAVCVAQYDLAIREEDGEQPSSHRNDLFMAVYLPYCDEFVSDDRGQQIRLREIVSLCKLTTKVRWYREFRDSFSINVVGAKGVSSSATANGRARKATKR